MQSKRCIFVATLIPLLSGLGAQETNYIPAALKNAMDLRFPAATIHELKTTKNKKLSKFELKLVDAKNRTPFKVVINGNGEILEESEHIISSDLVPTSLLELCDFFKKNRTVWRVRRSKGGERTFTYWSGHKPKFLQMYGVTFGSIKAQEVSERKFKGSFDVHVDTGMAKGQFQIESEKNNSHQLKLILKERRGNAFAFLDKVSGKTKSLKADSSAPSEQKNSEDGRSDSLKSKKGEQDNAPENPRASRR